MGITHLSRFQLAGAGCATVALVAWLGFSPYYAASQWSKAMLAKDMAGAQSWMDSESIRVSVLAMSKAKGKDGSNPAESRPNVMEDVLAAGIAQAMSTPEGLWGMHDMAQELSALTGSAKDGPSASSAPEMTGKAAYISPNRFGVLAVRNGKPLFRFVFHRRWLTWRLAEVTSAEDEPVEEIAGPAAIVPNEPLAVSDTEAKTRGGLLTVQSHEMSYHLLWNGRPLAPVSEEGEFLRLDRAYRFTNEDVVVIRKSLGGSGTIDTYRLAVITGSQAPEISEEFFPQSEDEPVFTRNGDRLNIDLGYQEGKRIQLVYQQGRLKLADDSGSPTHAADEQSCRYLYNDMYLAYVRGENRCGAGGVQNVSGMASMRAWNDFSNDPRLHLPVLEQLSNSTCNGGMEATYPQFKQAVCGG